MNSSKILIVLIALIIVAAVGWVIWGSVANRQELTPPPPPVDSVPEPPSLPPVMPSPTGTNGQAVEHNDLIKLTSPAPGEKIASPLRVTGEARGTWYFEASFPVTLTDWDGKVIAQTPAQAKGDWMTEEYVPFEAVLEFDTPSPGDPAVNRGTLILQKDNPSGLPEHDDALEIQITY